MDTKYKTDPAFAIQARRFLALAFVPPQRVHHYMRMIVQDEAHIGDGLLDDFARYFQSTYVGVENLPAMFPHTSWNMYRRIKENLPRTNNTVEAWHGAFAKDICNHPDIMSLSAKYRTEQHNQLLKRDQHRNGRRNIEGRSKYAKINKQIKTIIGLYDNGDLQNLPYLEEIAKAAAIKYTK